MKIHVYIPIPHFFSPLIQEKSDKEYEESILKKCFRSLGLEASFRKQTTPGLLTLIVLALLLEVSYLG